MDLHLQFGYGMKDHARTLLRKWGGGVVLLSPRDLGPGDIEKFGQQIGSILGSRVILDPQLYLPRSDHERLRSHDYWPQDYSTGGFWSGPGLGSLINDLVGLNIRSRCHKFVAPGLLASSVSDDWLAVQSETLAESAKQVVGTPVLATIALSAEVMRREEELARLIEESEGWPVEGYYLVVEHPNGRYLVDDPIWVTNVVDLAAGLKLQGRIVILGYCSHQMLVSSLAKVDAIASGTWMNVRSFPPDKFRQDYEEEVRQRATWYYCPQALSEYKVPFLDIARRVGKLHLLRPSEDFDVEYVDELFEGVTPSTVGLTEQAAFRHYLISLKIQAEQASLETFDATLDWHNRLIDGAETLLSELRAGGISGQMRDFSDSIDASRAAAAVLRSTRGAVLRRKWSDL